MSRRTDRIPPVTFQPGVALLWNAASSHATASTMTRIPTRIAMLTDATAGTAMAMMPMMIARMPPAIMADEDCLMS